MSNTHQQEPYTEQTPISTISQHKNVELKQLPGLVALNLQNDNEIAQLLYKSVAVLLKSMNIHISKLAMEDMHHIVANNIDNMMIKLHQMIENQRRLQTASMDDLNNFMESFMIENSDLVFELEKSQYINKVLRENEILNDFGDNKRKSNSNTMDNKGRETMIKDLEYVTELTKLLPNENKELISKIPTWLPKLPPAHTYKSTKMFTTKKFDEIIIKKNLVHQQHQISNNINNLENIIQQEMEREDDIDKEKSVGKSVGSISKKMQSRLRSENKSIFNRITNLEDYQDIPANILVESMNTSSMGSNKKFDVLDYCINKNKRSSKLKKIDFLKNSNKKNPFIRGMGLQNNNKLMENFIRKYVKRSYDGFYKNTILQSDRIAELKKLWVQQYVEQERNYKVMKKERKKNLIEKLRLEKELKEQEEKLQQQIIAKPIVLNIKPLLSTAVTAPPAAINTTTTSTFPAPSISSNDLANSATQVPLTRLPFFVTLKYNKEKYLANGGSKSVLVTPTILSDGEALQTPLGKTQVAVDADIETRTNELLSKDQVNPEQAVNSQSWEMQGIEGQRKEQVEEAQEKQRMEEDQNKERSNQVNSSEQLKQSEGTTLTDRHKESIEGNSQADVEASKEVPTEAHDDAQEKGKTSSGTEDLGLTTANNENAESDSANTQTND